ncbi:hypothetical protein SAMN05892873_104100 [Aeromonas veronii]|nr:hypothetical protein SAMN05892873_104100 [Aeromonas veronii]
MKLDDLQRFDAKPQINKKNQINMQINNAHN